MVWIPSKLTASPQTVHYFILTVATMVALLAMLSVLVSTLVLRSLLAKAVDAIPGIDVNLMAALGGGFSQLVGRCEVGVGRR